MNLVPANTQQAEFAFRTLPDLFHQAPAQFLELLEQNGNQFLTFYWNGAGKRMNIPEATVPFGLDFAIQHATSLLTAGWISFPRPTIAGEAFFAAFIYRPTRVSMIPGVQDTSKVLLLVNPSDSSEVTGAPVVEVTRRFGMTKLMEDVLPEKTAFHDAVAYILKNNL